jgi:hypothetical protein
MPERSHGKMRPSLPRASDLPTVVEPVAIPSVPRDSGGRFAPGASADRAENRIRELIADGLGRGLQGEGGELGRRAVRLYRAFLRDLPCVCTSVRSIVAQRARAATLADAYARLGMEHGIADPVGLGALQEAAKWDARAERLAVSALAESVRFAKVARERPQVTELDREYERELAAQRAAHPTEALPPPAANGSGEAGQ